MSIRMFQFIRLFVTALSFVILLVPMTGITNESYLTRLLLVSALAAIVSFMAAVRKHDRKIMNVNEELGGDGAEIENRLMAIIVWFPVILVILALISIYCANASGKSVGWILVTLALTVGSQIADLYIFRQ